MPSIQRYLPVVQEGKTNHILGMLDLGSNQTYDGDEPTQTISTPAGNQDIPLIRIEPPASINPRNPWYMAAVFTHEQVYNRAHEGFAEFVRVEDVLPAHLWSSPSGLPNRLVEYNGPLIDGLSNENGFGLGGIAVNTEPPEVSGVLEVGETLTASEGVWAGETDSFEYQWQENDGGWTDVPNEDAETFVPGAAGEYRVGVRAVNNFGTSAFTYSDSVTVVTP